MSSPRPHVASLPERHVIAATLKNVALDALVRDEQPWLELADLVQAMFEGRLVTPADLAGGDLSWQAVPVEALGLMRSAYSPLLAAGLATAGDVDEVDDARLLSLPSLGTGSLGRIRSAIRRLKDA